LSGCASDEADEISGLMWEDLKVGFNNFVYDLGIPPGYTPPEKQKDYRMVRTRQLDLDMKQGHSGYLANSGGDEITVYGSSLAYNQTYADSSSAYTGYASSNSGVTIYPLDDSSSDYGYHPRQNLTSNSTWDDTESVSINSEAVSVPVPLLRPQSQ
jgi:hypothetical protein